MLAFLALLAMTPDDIMAHTAAATRADTTAWHESITLMKHVRIEKNATVEQKEFLLFGAQGYTMELLKKRNGIPAPDSLQKVVGTDIPRLIVERVACYTFTLQDTDQHHGRPVYVLTFVPRAPSCESDDTEEHVAELAAGTVWIDQERFCIWKLQGTLSKSISKAVVCSISRFHIEFEQQLIGMLVVPARSESTFTHGCLFTGNTTEHRVVIYDTPAPITP